MCEACGPGQHGQASKPIYAVPPGMIVSQLVVDIYQSIIGALVLAMVLFVSHVLVAALLVA